MTKKRLFAILLAVLAFSAVVGASFANAAGGTAPPTPAVVEDANSVDHQCPPDCNVADKAEAANEAQQAEEPDGATEAPDATGSDEGSNSEGAPGAEAAGDDSHEDAAGSADHQCQPDCDVAGGETP